ncbi:MAG: hypothetical protein LUQ71_06675 [Methanoregula sp.]|jgi:hypothetical protein|nr:hypothetical protein [Methanoregula sp.]
MTLLDDLGTEMKKVETELHKAELDKQIRDLGQGINKAGHELSAEILKSQDSPSAENTVP